MLRPTGSDLSVFTTITPTYAEVLEVRAGRVAMVRDFLAAVTSDELAAARTNPWNPEYQETTLSCLHVNPRGGVGAPSIRRTRPRRDRGVTQTATQVGQPGRSMSDAPTSASV